LKPNPEAAAEVRKQLGITPDTFVVGMVADNGFPISPTRKSFPEMFQAFAIFHDRHPDSVLYLHTDVLGLNGGLNLVALADTFGVPQEAIRAVDQEKYATFCELDTQHMAYTYSAFDVLAMPSHGEGFGIPLIEAQACGTPVITCDWTAMAELVGPGWLVDGEPFYNPGAASMWMKPAISEILDRLELAYAAKGDQKVREMCRRFALRYDADTVFEEQWTPVLEKLARPREVAPLPQLSPETRRAKIKAKAKVPA
jgi:glycosyltransferase involved in cell wall biosynthesis